MGRILAPFHHRFQEKFSEEMLIGSIFLRNVKWQFTEFTKNTVEVIPFPKELRIIRKSLLFPK